MAKEYDYIKELQKLLGIPIENICISFFDDFIQNNAEFRTRAGLKEYIIRTELAKCCKWCHDLAGTYEYTPTMDTEVFRKHDNCRCLVVHSTQKGNFKDVWSKKEFATLTKAREERIKDILNSNAKGLKKAKNSTIMEIIRRNAKKIKGGEGVATLQSYISLPEKLRKAFSDVAFDFGFKNSACDKMNRTIRVGVYAEKHEIDHEFGHLVEEYILNKEAVDEYKRYLVEGLTIKDIYVDFFHDNYGNSVEAVLVRSDRLVTPYQGRLYPIDGKDFVNDDGSINIDCLGEVIAEPFMMKCSNILTDKRALEIINSIYE